MYIVHSTHFAWHSEAVIIFKWKHLDRILTYFYTLFIVEMPLKCARTIQWHLFNWTTQLLFFISINQLTVKKRKTANDWILKYINLWKCDHVDSRIWRMFNRIEMHNWNIRKWSRNNRSIIGKVFCCCCLCVCLSSCSMKSFPFQVDRNTCFIQL